MVCFLFVSLSAYALPSDKEVTAWTSNVLRQTVTADYQQLKLREKKVDVGKYYSNEAWAGLAVFLGDMRSIIIRYKLTTNPIPLEPAEVVQKGKIAGINYWHIEQKFEFPGVGKILWFSVIVIQNDYPPFKIESLSMKKYTIPCNNVNQPLIE
ncbi:hypothetical protein [Legionella tunisiensis]|uniref:hypothetical protein n=1 Tax=Legionella tunisiensis TaxID=1034944 RepID=UPI0012EAF1A7|nr:hypothetical protein [Legionella tunisiensis]